MLKRELGFTLIELMITVAIVGILAALAYPSYDEYIKRSSRAEGQAFLSDASARQERYYAQNYKFASSIKALYGGSATSRSSENKKYSLEIKQEEGDGGYSLIAAPQFTDAKCGSFTLTAKGDRSVTGTKGADYCWR